MKHRTTISLALLALFLAVTYGFAQRYDPATVVTISGSVAEVSQNPGRMGWPGTHILVTTAVGVVEVHLGPTHYLNEQGLKLVMGDRVEVTGSKVQIDGAEAVIARELKIGDRLVTLRNSSGVPLWSRGRRR